MAKRNAKMKNGDKGSRSSSDLVPHPSELRKHFTPKEVEQSGLGVAFFAVVAAIIILLLLSVFGGYHITGSYNRVSADLFKPVSISFTQFSGSSFNVASYSGKVNGVKVEVASPPGSDMVFKFGADSVRQAFIVTKKIDPTSLPAGSVVYYDGTGWVLFTTSASGNAQPLSLYAKPSSAKPYGAITFDFSPGVSSATQFSATLKDYRFVPGTAASLREAGRWIIKWTNDVPVALSGIFYDYGAGMQPVTFGFDSPTGSRITSSDTTVTLRYNHDPRWS